SDDGLDISVADSRPPLPLTPLLLGGVAEIRSPAKLERIDSKKLCSEVVLHVIAHAFDDGDDGNEEHDTDSHAEQREEALQLLHADLREREPDCVQKGHETASAWCGFR